MALCRRGRLSIFRGEVGSGHAASGEASRVNESERGGVEKSGVAFAKANASRLFERSHYRKMYRKPYTTKFKPLRDYGTLPTRKIKYLPRRGRERRRAKLGATASHIPQNSNRYGTMAQR